MFLIGLFVGRTGVLKDATINLPLIRRVFAWGGVGQYGLNAIVRGDFTAVQAYVMMLAFFSVVVFLVVDLVVYLIEPRAELQ